MTEYIILNCYLEARALNDAIIRRTGHGRAGGREGSAYVMLKQLLLKVVTLLLKT